MSIRNNWEKPGSWVCGIWSLRLHAWVESSLVSLLPTRSSVNLRFSSLELADRKSIVALSRTLESFFVFSVIGIFPFQISFCTLQFSRKNTSLCFTNCTDHRRFSRFWTKLIFFSNDERLQPRHDIVHGDMKAINNLNLGDVKNSHIFNRIAGANS